MDITTVPRANVLDVLATLIEDVDVVLDLGAGIKPQEFVRSPLVHICVDAHRPYLDRLKRDQRDDRRFVLLNARWDEVLPMFPDRSVDSVFALDFIEHLEKEDGFRMLREAQRVARVQVVVYTPNGFFPQHHEPGQPDRWGFNVIRGGWRRGRALAGRAK